MVFKNEFHRSANYKLQLIIYIATIIQQFFSSICNDLLQTSNLQELVSGLYAMSVMQNAEKETVQTLEEATLKLEELERTAQVAQAELVNDQQTLQIKADALDDQVAALKVQLAGNQAALAEIAQSKEGSYCQIKV